MTRIEASVKHMAGRIAVRCGLARIVRFRRDQRGATTIEFAIVAVPFIALMFAILETALAFFAAQTMETAVQNAARLIRTGQAQKAGLDADTFKGKICDQISMLFNCTGGMKLDVRKYATFDSINLAPPLDADGNLKTDGYVYVPGKGGDIVVVRAYYQWPVFVNTLGTNTANLGNGKHLISSTAAFKNEPFPW